MRYFNPDSWDPRDKVSRVFYLYIVEMENVPEDTHVKDLPRMYREPMNAVSRFEVVGDCYSEHAALMLYGKAFKKGWKSHNTMSFVTQSYQPTFSGGNQ
mgnify:FL=1